MADVFISYSHKDSHWKDRVVTFLDVMKHGEPKLTWVDSQIELGDEWHDTILRQIDQAKVAVLLISPDFLRSEYILKTEIPAILTRCKKGELSLAPVVVRPCPWEVFDWLRPIQGLCADEATLSGLSDHEVDVTLTELARSVVKTITNQESEKDAAAETVAQVEKARLEEEGTAQALGATLGDFEQPDTDGSLVKGKFLTNAGIVKLIEQYAPDNHPSVGLLRIFRTSKQRTWLAATTSRLYCVLDDDKTRAKNRRVQWSLALSLARPVRVRPRSGKATGLVDIGIKRNWLYSQRWHPKPAKLEETIRLLLDAATGVAG